MDATSIMIEMLKQKRYITPLEQDILDTWNTLQKNPFDINSARQQTVSNDINHPDIFTKVNALPTTVLKPTSEVNAQDWVYILSTQLAYLIEKERQALYNG